MHALQSICGVAAAPPAPRDQLINTHLPLVHSVARRLAHHAAGSPILEYDDLVGYGCEGLIAAVETFDPTRGAMFTTWAVFRIRTTILERLRALAPMPRALHRRRQAIDQTRSELAHQCGCWPEDAAVAAALQLPLPDLRRVLQETDRTVVSLEHLTDGHDNDARPARLSSLADDDPPGSPQQALDAAERAVEHRRQVRDLRALVARLPARERRVVQAYYLEQRPLREIAQELGVTESRVSQVHSRARTRLQAAIRKRPAHPTPHRAA